MTEKIRGLWEYKYLIYNLVQRDLKVKYKGSALGFFWSLLNPLFMLVVYTVAFQYVIKIKVPNFSIFLFAGLLPWNFLTATLSMGVGAISDNANLVKKIYFPREILPLSVVLVNLFHFLLTFLVLTPALFFFGMIPGPAFLFLPVIIVFQALFVLGLTLFTSALNVYYRDVKHMQEVLLQLWFWGTPIIWSLELVPDRFRYLALLNPFTHFTGAYRAIILEGVLPSPLTMTALAAASLLMFAAGYRVFKKKQRRFAEEI